jgi:hypothetical protein
MSRRAVAATSFAALALALPLGACGESEQEKAQQAVCDARDDMAERVDALKAMTPATFTADAVRDNVSAIRNDLRDIGDARADLSDDRRQEVEDATREFTSAVEGIASEALRSISASDARSQLTAAAQQLSDSYEQSFARITCD